MNFKFAKLLLCGTTAFFGFGIFTATADAAPLSGVTAVVNSDASNGTIDSTYYSTRSGVSLCLSNMLTDATSPKDYTADSSSSGSAADDYANIGIAQVNDYVNVRDTNSEEGEVVGKLYNNSACNVEEETADGWYKITSGNVNGYVKSDYVVVGDKDLVKSASRRVATVQTQTLYVREDASTDSSVIGMVPEEDDLTVTDETDSDNGWVKVSVEEGDGYVSTEYVALSTEYTYAESKAEEAARLAREEAERQKAAAAAARNSYSGGKSSGSGRTYSAASGSGGAAVASYAQQFLGNPYVYGGSSLTNGTDCSGFVMSVYAAYGVSLPHSSSAMRSSGYGVSYDNMQAGDIVCYSGHVGIYVGGGSIISASNPKSGIKYSNVNYRTILAIRRIF